MAEFFSVIPIEATAETPEYLGTKEKFWIKQGGVWHLVKFGRQGTGEDWAEKVACELCGLLSLPHAHYDLATYKGERCVISPTMIEAGARLIVGNELINRVTPDYDGAMSYQQRQHTVSRVLAALTRFTTDHESSLKNFLGYLMLDAWIGNTDRHHENWGLIIDKTLNVRLAPTFDHASSMGRELTDHVRHARLKTKDNRYSVGAFAAKARSALYDSPADKRALSPTDAFFSAAGKLPKIYLEFWISKLSDVSDDDIRSVVYRLPGEVATEAAKLFAIEILSINRESILSRWRDE